MKRRANSRYIHSVWGPRLHCGRVKSELQSINEMTQQADDDLCETIANCCFNMRLFDYGPYKILDVGCGTMQLASTLRNHFNGAVQYTGVDKKTMPRNIIAPDKYYQVDINDYRACDQWVEEIARDRKDKFDAIVMQESMLYFDDCDSVIQTLKNLVHFDGIIVIVQPMLVQPVDNDLYKEIISVFPGCKQIITAAEIEHSMQAENAEFELIAGYDWSSDAYKFYNHLADVLPRQPFNDYKAWHTCLTERAQYFATHKYGPLMYSCNVYGRTESMVVDVTK